ncbi:hypothetical protein P1P68_16755 [Streptomyces scabiei]|uniref:hypothetical protein n=1 Tax=Streptomyces scabiei TaxID=1930 RepID=UPI00298FFDC0|nr:hypothetical protein [Streptomyces scabiei]MDW8806390.1 hypothetical protein [Streptomyces scabiei]
MDLLVGVLVIVLGLPLTGLVSLKVANGRLQRTGMAIWFLGSPALLVLGGWLILRAL